jgi:hypothetical protein
VSSRSEEVGQGKRERTFPGAEVRPVSSAARYAAAQQIDQISVIHKQSLEGGLLGTYS